MSAFHSFKIPFDGAFQQGPRRRIRIRQKRARESSESSGDSEPEPGESGESNGDSKPRPDESSDVAMSSDEPAEPSSEPGAAEPGAGGHPAPPFPFAHAPPATGDPAPRRRPPTLAALDAAFAPLRPPLPFDVAQEIGGTGGSSSGSGARAGTLKRRHAAALTAVLHRCLRRRDWVRAGRAFGLLLRTEMGGAGVELRRHGLWGMGAEILLRAPGQQAEAEAEAARARRLSAEDGTARGEDPAEGARGEDARAGAAPPFFTPEGMARARRYYERLVLQYPFRARAPAGGLPSAVHFYRALFGLWIACVDDGRQRGRPATGDASPADAAAHEDNAEADEAARAVYRRAGEIARRMDDVLAAFPHADDPELWQLRGHVARWMADLAAASPDLPVPQAAWDENADPPGSSEAAMQRERAGEALARAASLRKASQTHLDGANRRDA